MGGGGAAGAFQKCQVGNLSSHQLYLGYQFRFLSNPPPSLPPFPPHPQPHGRPSPPALRPTASMGSRGVERPPLQQRGWQEGLDGRRAAGRRRRFPPSF